MRPFDSIFIILVFTPYIKDPKLKYVVTFLPLLVLGFSSIQVNIAPEIASWVLPFAAIVLCVLSPKLAPIGLILLFVEYNKWSDTLLIPTTYFAVEWLMKELSDRIDSDFIPEYLKGFPIRFISLGIFYFIFYPLTFI